jgi:ubiquinone/menaquinone biosynthesis C-methylase UbiE
MQGEESMTQGYDIKQLESLEEGWFFYDHAWSLLFEVLRNIVGDTVLDVGCGTGVALSVMKALFPWRTYRGIDPSGDASTIWKARGIEVDVGSATHLPYADNSWHSVYSSHVIEHIDDDRTAVSEMVRVASRRAIIVVPDGDVGAKNFGTPHIKVYDRINFKNLIEAAAGSTCTVKVYSLPHIHISNLIAIADKRFLP